MCLVSNCLNCLLQANNSLLVNTVQVPESDIMATNGVIHYINQVLYPGGNISTQNLFLLQMCRDIFTRHSFYIIAMVTIQSLFQISQLETKTF